MMRIWLLVKLLKDIPKVWRITNKNPKCPAYSVSIHLRFRICPGTMNLILVPLNIPPCWSFTGHPELSNPDVANTWKIPHRIQELWRITIIQTQILIKAQVRLAIKKLQKRRRGIHHKILCSLGEWNKSGSRILVFGIPDYEFIPDTFLFWIQILIIHFDRKYEFYEFY